MKWESFVDICGNRFAVYFASGPLKTNLKRLPNVLQTD